MQLKRISFAVVMAASAVPLMAQQPVAPTQTSPAGQPVMIQMPVPVIPGLTVPAGAAGQSVGFPMPAATPAGAAQTQNAEKWLERMGDFTQNASAFKDPKTFNQWFGAMTDPSMAGASMNMMMEPGNWIRMTSSMMQPGAVTNYMGFADPNVYMKWTGAMMDPNFYMQNMGAMMDPSRMMRWMMVPMDPKFMQSSVNMMNPNTYMKWMMAPMDPRVWGLMFAPMNPQLYGSMAGAVVNPNTVGGNWQTFMYPKYPVVNLSPAAPVNIPMNVLDPSTWGNMMGMINGFLPMGTQQMFSGMGQPGGGFAIPFFGTGANPYMLAPAAVAPATAPALAMQPGVPARLSLAGDALFKTAKSSIKDLTAEGKARLDKLAADIKAAGKIETIRIVGHADKTGKAAANMVLSQKRAAAVASYLKAQGVKAGMFITAGKGDAQPLVQCDMKLPKEELKACLQPNRRVEVEVTVAR